MKMEFAVHAPCSGKLTHLFCKEGGAVAAGQDLLVIEEACNDPAFDIQSLRKAYLDGSLTPTKLVEEIIRRTAEDTNTPVWIHKLPAETLHGYAQALEGKDIKALPLVRRALRHQGQY